MKKLLTLLMLSGFVFWLASCSDDDEVVDLDAPVVTAPAAASVQVNGTINLDFSVTAAAGYASATVAPSGGTATITAQPEVGATSGTVTVQFVADATTGAGSVVLTVTDGEGDQDDATAIINKSASPVPNITGIPATASVVAGENLGPVPATIEMANVPGTLTITRNGMAYGDPIEITTDGQTVNFTYPTDIEEAGSTITFEFTAEDADGDTDVVTHVLTVAIPQVETIVVTENISAAVTWETGKIYELAGRITVLPGATLTIQPGVVVKGQPGTGANASSLLVARGAVLNANGTAESPIIFTATSDDLIPGQTRSPNLEPTVSGLWGGVLILGNARISVSTDAESFQIEGIPPSDTNGLYGGTNDADNSGTLTYVSIRHGGSDIGEGNEINGLTLGGVGSGTTIENVEVVGNQDDGIEWFGGTANVTNALVWNAGDDAIDTDQAWRGTLSNFVVIAGEETDHALEIDGPEGSYGDNLSGPTVTNGTIFGHPNAELGDFRDGARGTFSDIYFVGFPSPATAGRGDLSISGDESLANLAAGDLAFSNLQTTLPDATTTLANVFRNGVDANATAVAADANTVGADLSVFTWTWASREGELD